MSIFAKRWWLTAIFLGMVVSEIFLFLFNTIDLFLQKSQKEIAHLLESKKNATMSMAITAAELIDPQRLTKESLKQMSLLLKRHTRFKNIWFKIVDANGTIRYSNIGVVNRDFFQHLPWRKQYFSDFVLDCKGIHIASFAPIHTKVFQGFFGVISQFNSIQKELEKEGIDSVTVVDKKQAVQAFGIYQNIAGYKVVNLSPNPRFLELLQKLDLDRLIDTKFLFSHGMIIGAYPLKNHEQKIVGWIFYAKPFDRIIFDLFSQKIFIYIGLFFALLIGYLILLFRLFYRQQHALKRYYRKILEQLGEIVFITDGKEIRYANRRFYEVFGRKVACILDLFVEEEGFLRKKDWIDFLHHQKRARVKIRQGNREYIFMIHATKIAPSEYSIVMIDITRQYYYEKSLEEKALRDSLTGLLNRYTLIQSFLRLKEESQIDGSEILLVLFDIDHFKKINDRYGHDKGDFVLKEVAKILQSFFRSEDLLFRIGGEEFLLLIKTKNIQKILELLYQVKTEIAEHDFDGIHLTISIGVAKWCGEDFEKLFKRADEALYRAKNEGRNKIIYEGDCLDP